MPEANRVMLSVQVTPDAAGIRTAEFRGSEHTIIPCVALVEGVLWAANAKAPELALAEEFGRFPESWDGRPVVYDHPRVDGVPVSASTPDILEVNAFGQLFNTKLEDGKLKTEIWINNDLVANLSEEGQGVVERLKDGDEVVEVSTGLFMMSERISGEFDGEAYEGIWRSVSPDHLAVLPPGVPGACSIADGCGAPRTNEGDVAPEFSTSDGTSPFVPVMRAAMLNEDCSCQTIVVDATGVDAETEKGLFQRIMEMGGEFLGIRNSSEGLSDGDIRAALSSALNEVEDRFSWIVSVFRGKKDSGTFVYEVNFGEALLERTFKIKNDTITIGSDAVAVRPETKFVPVEVVTANDANSTIQENAMNKEELVNGLIANAATQWTDDDKEWLNGLDEDQLQKMSPVANAAADDPPETDAAAEAAEAARIAANTAADDATPVSTEDYIKNAPPEIQAVLTSGVQMHSNRKKVLVEALVANERNTFDKAILESKDVAELEQLVALAIPDADYEANGIGNGANLRAADDNSAPPAPKLFDLNPQSNAA